MNSPDKSRFARMKINVRYQVNRRVNWADNGVENQFIRIGTYLPSMKSRAALVVEGECTQECDEGGEREEFQTPLFAITVSNPTPPTRPEHQLKFSTFFVVADDCCAIAID